METTNIYNEDYKKIEKIKEEWKDLVKMNIADVVHLLVKTYELSVRRKNFRVKRMIGEVFKANNISSLSVIPYIEAMDLSECNEKSIQELLRRMEKNGALPSNLELDKLCKELFNRITSYPMRKLEEDEKEEIKQKLEAGESYEKLANEYLIPKSRLYALKAWITMRKGKP